MKNDNRGLALTREAGLREAVTLSNGRTMPWLGLGVFQIEDQKEAERVVRTAIDRGYRHIDTAALYGNEAAVGKAVRECGVDRSELFVTSKVWNSDMREGRVDKAFEESMKRLGLDYVDLYLLHWPIEGKIGASWVALERFYREERAKSIGVSNYLIRHLEELMESASTAPVVNQVEYHPYLQSRELKSYCDSRQIRLEAWSPFMHGGAILQDPELERVARSHGKSVAQTIIRWILQTGVVTIPKTIREARMVENSDVFDFALSEEEMGRIAALDRGARWGADPERVDF